MEILIIEDSPEDGFLITRALRLMRIDAKVSVITSGSTALGMLVCCKIVPGLIILDVKLPTLSGVEVAKCIRQLPHLKGVEIVVFSDQESPEVKSEAERSGVSQYVVKAVSSEGNAYKLKRILLDWKARVGRGALCPL